MEGSRKRATDGKVDGGKETGGHSKDEKSRNQHELNKAEAAPTKASDAIFDINRLIDDAEKRSSDHVDAITGLLNDVCELSHEYVDRITDGRTNIGDYEKKGRNNILVPLLKEAETFTTECKTSTSDSSHKCNVKSCVLLGNRTVLYQLQSVGALGIFPCPGDDINIRGPTDGDTCFVSGLLALADGRLLMSDMKNENIKLFDVNHELVSDVRLQSNPTDIAEIDGGQVAVCLPYDTKIQLVSVSGILTLGRIIETAVECRSVTRCGDNLAAVNYTSPDIVEIDMMGRRVTTVWTHPDAKLQYIIHNTRGELITTGFGGVVTRMNRDGVVLARYQGDNLRVPRALTVHPDGSIYVCDSWSNNIHHITLTADCTRSIEVFGDGQISASHSICYNQHHNSLYVSQNGLTQLDNDFMKVFRLGY